MEPWDGPASIVFSDGAVVGAVLDRNGSAVALLRYHGRPGDPGLGGGRARYPAGAGLAEGSPATRPDAAGRYN
ncbi:MAG: hypothetical protein IPM60_15305 [Rhodospirillales bacterium]|nr:hypothetical protein [Rhodospirillales bacterium]